MNQELPLADIHTPSDISMWPPAYGWWILAVLILAVIFVVIRALKKRRQKRVQRNFAISELDKVNLQDFSAGQQINEILKRAAMVYYSRQKVASLTGKKWKIFLLHCLGKEANSTKFDDSWLDFGYGAKVEAQQVIDYHQFAKLWLSKALPGDGEMPDFDQALAQLEQGA